MRFGSRFCRGACCTECFIGVCGSLGLLSAAARAVCRGGVIRCAQTSTAPELELWGIAGLAETRVGARPQKRGLARVDFPAI